MTTATRATATSPSTPGPGGRPGAPWRAIGTGAGVLGGESVACYLHPVLGAVLAAADTLVPLAIGLILLIAILRGSAETCERVFRLLRWITNRPEPRAPGPASARGAG